MQRKDLQLIWKEVGALKRTGNNGVLCHKSHQCAWNALTETKNDLCNGRLLAGDIVRQILTEATKAGAYGISEPQVQGAAAQQVQVSRQTSCWPVIA